MKIGRVVIGRAEKGYYLTDSPGGQSMSLWKNPVKMLLIYTWDMIKRDWKTISEKLF